VGGKRTFGVAKYTTCNNIIKNSESFRGGKIAASGGFAPLEPPLVADMLPLKSKLKYKVLLYYSI